jgi:hypothetical protein
MQPLEKAQKVGPSVTLTWDRNPETNIAGYKLKCETASATTGQTIELDRLYRQRHNDDGVQPELLETISLR